ncbi:hypothetical protein F2Q69_00061045 [Brassica cretica]|uniref:Uncharacterized protein n=1 Tax=Brassica cretica TaxID=69181 RepID=A0A8S9RBS2_BRACR|nr:hypothetical protein F2Q69_00061045 [Brassica cretica]
MYHLNRKIVTTITDCFIDGSTFSSTIITTRRLLTSSHPFPPHVRLILVGFCQRRLGILKTHCFGLVARDKCHDIADHFSYAGSGCHSYDI